MAIPTEGMALTIVGRGQLDPAVPFGDLDQRGPVGDEPGGGQYQTSRASPAVLLVDGVDAIAASPPLEGTGPDVHLDRPARRLEPSTRGPPGRSATRWTQAGHRPDRGRPRLHPDQPGTASSATELIRADAAAGRLLLIGSLGVAILLAFAVFLALVIRDDVAAELTRLAAVGARRRDRAAFLILEALIPALVGGDRSAGSSGASSSAPWRPRRRSTRPPSSSARSSRRARCWPCSACSWSSSWPRSWPRRPGCASARRRGVGAAVAGTALVILGWQLAAGGSLGRGRPGPLAGQPGRRPPAAGPRLPPGPRASWPSCRRSCAPSPAARGGHRCRSACRCCRSRASRPDRRRP